MKSIAHVLTAVVGAPRQTSGRLPEVIPDALAPPTPRSGAVLRRVQPDALGRALLDRPKIVTRPSATVAVAVASVPHITLSCVVMIVPSCGRATAGAGNRAGPRRAAAHMTVNVGVLTCAAPPPAGAPTSCDNPSPWNGLSAAIV